MHPHVLSPANHTIVHDEGRRYTAIPVAEIIVNGFFTVNKQWTMQYWNKAAEKILKIKAADIVGKNFWKVFAGIIPLEFYAVYHKAFQSDIPIHFEEYWGEMDSWFDVVTYYCDNTLSVSFKSSNTSPDPNHPSSLEQQLQIKTGLYEFITKVTNDCLWEWDLVTKEIFWIDGGHKRVFGYPEENALIPQSFWEDHIHAAYRSRVLAKINSMQPYKNGDVWEVEYGFRKATGQYAWVKDRGHIIYDASNNCRMIGASQEISERVLLEQQLVNERIARENEITALAFTAQEKEWALLGKELMDNTSHALCVAKLYLEMARTDTANTETLMNQSAKYITEMLESMRHIAKVIAPPFIHLLGLVSSIKIFTEDASKDYPVVFTTLDSGLNLVTLMKNYNWTYSELCSNKLTI